MRKKKIYTEENSNYLLSQEDFKRIEEIDSQTMHTFKEIRTVLNDLVANGEITKEESNSIQLLETEQILRHDFIPNDLRDRYRSLKTEKRKLLIKSNFDDILNVSIIFSNVFIVIFFVVEIIQFFAKVFFEKPHNHLFEFERDAVIFFVICALLYCIPKFILNIIVDCEDETERKKLSRIVLRIFSRISFPLLFIIWFL